MKASIRWWSRLAFISGLGLTTLAACSSDRADGHGEEKRAGSLALALQTTSASGSVYRLRNAFFQITNVRTGDTVQFLSSEDNPDSPEIKTMLDRSDYTVTLQPGWQLERVSGPTGGTGGTGATAGAGGVVGTGGFGTAGKSSFPPPSEGGAFDAPAFPAPFPGPFPVPTFGGEGGEDSGTAGTTSAGGSFSVGGEGPVAGTGPTTGGSSSTGGTSSNGGTIVDAQLVSNAVQFFSIFGGDDEFVSYQFKVGGEIIDFNKGRLHVVISVDDSEACQVPDGVTRPERVLLENNTDALVGVGLHDAFKALANNGGHTGDGDLLYQQVFDSYATADQASLPDAVHCGDETTDGVATLNGFPIDCNRVEKNHVNDIGNFFATAFVNRIDLAPANGAHCGQQRMIFANPAQGRAFMILEAQIPNPQPELGIDGCKPLAQFWLDQNTNPDAKSRGARLAQAFLFGGVPGLAELGFGAFFTAENLTVGSGQIRTNQFDQDPWTLREFKLAIDGDTLRALPFPVAESPNGGLWNEGNPSPQGAACRESFLSALDGVLTDDMSLMSFVVDSACKDAESRNDFSEDYQGQLSNGFRDQLKAKLAAVGSPLSADDIANRARFAGSCIGCHNEASGSFLGNGVFAPFSNDFPQVVEFTEQCPDGESGNCFQTSNALKTVFLPGRLQVLSNLLGVPVVTNPCTGGGGGSGGSTSGGFGGSFGTAGSPPSAGSFGMGTAGTSTGTGGASGGTGGMTPPPPIPADPAPAPVIEIELPPATEPVEQMQEEDAEIRQDYGDVTISGKSAKATH